MPPAGGPVEEPPTEPAPEVADPTRAPPAPGPDTVTRHVAGRGRAGPVVVALTLVAVLAAGAGLFVAARDEDRPGTELEAGVTTSAASTTTTAVDRLSAQDAFAQAADRLVAGGSFGYAGTSSATDVSHVRPGLWLAVELTVEGEVETSAESVHEIAVDGDGRATETVTAGPIVWGRLATSREALADATYLPITEESGGQGAGKGAALLPAWLDSTVARQDAGTDGRGHRVLRATLPASVLGEVVDGRPAGDASVLLTLDAEGDPVRVEVTSVPTGPPLRLALDLLRIGEPVVIDLPAEAPTA
jgi:predicted lipoprotein